MARGKKKGSTKNTLEIRDECISPFYLIQDDRQFTKMIEGNPLPKGYYTKLESALTSITRELLIKENAGCVFNIKQYLIEYEDISNKIINQLT